MDKYTLNDKIGEGVLGIVHKVTPKDVKNSPPLVIKQVECQDFTSAQNALNEYRIFHTLNSPFVCKLTDSFVTWNAKVSTAFACYIMEYFDKGDLATHLNKLRTASKPVPIECIHVWLASMVEGVAYLHKNNLAHRNLKPSSFYLRALSHDTKQTLPDLTKLLIGDFGVITVMKDAKTKTRIPLGAFDYVAPEIIDSSATAFDFKSDIWTIGSCLLDICTTSLYDHKQFHMNLLNVRHDDDLLNKMLEQIYNVYESKALVNSLKYMLNKNKDKRPSIKAVIHDDFVQQCLETIQSDLVRYVPKNRHGNEHGNVDALLPKDLHSFAKLADFIDHNQAKENLMEAACARLSDMSTREDFDLLNDLNQKLLLKLLQSYSNNQNVQATALALLENALCLSLSEKTRAYIHEHVLERFFFVFLKFDRSLDIQLTSIRILVQLSNFERITEQLAKYDVIKYLLKDLDNFGNDANLCAYTCNAIWCLCINEHILRTLFNRKCLKYARHVLEKHQKSASCVEMACNVVLAMCADERLIAAEEKDVDMTSAILQAAQLHLHSPNIVKSVCMCFCSLISVFEECAFRFLYLPSQNNNGKDLDGIELLRDAYDIHKDKSDVVENVCLVFKDLSNYSEMIDEMKSIRLDETLFSDIVKRYRDNESVSKICSVIILRMNAVRTGKK